MLGNVLVIGLSKEGEDAGESKNTPSTSTSTQIPMALEQLVTHIPDLVVHRSHGEPLPQTIHSYGVVMFTDISGGYFAVSMAKDYFEYYSNCYHSSHFH